MNFIKHVLLRGNEHVTSGYGWRVLRGLRKFHKALDIISLYRIADKVIAIADGVVEKVTYDQWRGYYVQIRHNSRIISHYQHLAYGTIPLRVGQKIKKGEVLGQMGQSGDSMGIHLDFQIIVDGKNVDPTPYLTGEKSINPEILSFKILDDDLNIRTRPSTKTGAIIGQHKKGDIVKVSSTAYSKGWGRFNYKYKGKTINAFSNFVSPYATRVS